MLQSRVYHDPVTIANSSVVGVLVWIKSSQAMIVRAFATTSKPVIRPGVVSQARAFLACRGRWARVSKLHGESCGLWFVTAMLPHFATPLTLQLRHQERIHWQVVRSNRYDNREVRRIPAMALPQWTLSHMHTQNGKHKSNRTQHTSISTQHLCLGIAHGTRQQKTIREGNPK